MLNTTCVLQASNSLRHHVPARAKEAGIHLPCIVKSAAACGATDAHRMTILTDWNQTESLFIPEEAVLQQFHNHGGWLHKVYVIGNKVHLTSHLLHSNTQKRVSFETQRRFLYILPLGDSSLLQQLLANASAFANHDVQFAMP